QLLGPIRECLEKPFSGLDWVLVPPVNVAAVAHGQNVNFQEPKPRVFALGVYVTRGNSLIRVASHAPSTVALKHFLPHFGIALPYHLPPSPRSLRAHPVLGSLAANHSPAAFDFQSGNGFLRSFRGLNALALAISTLAINSL